MLLQRRERVHPRTSLEASASAIAVPIALCLGATVGCDEKGGPGLADPPPLSRTTPSEPAAPASATAPRSPTKQTPPATEQKRPASARCPQGMAAIGGGPFWVGSYSGAAAAEESPRFKTVIAPFCLDALEVTVSDYKRCQDAGKCTRAHDESRTCNTRHADRTNHPMNCVDWHQATAYCAWRGARLPSEFEWEFAARGGDEYRTYSWGNDKPTDDKLCWKRGHSCEVGQYPAGAFGLRDMTGNVWEWTSTSFGPYPWPPATGRQRGYRGGSFSRRFPKWLRTRLRNRYPARESGSHLGMRCALTLPSIRCEYGRTKDGATCLHGVSELACDGHTRWNGVRCAAEGAPECPQGRKRVPGHGCVLTLDVEGEGPKVASTPVVRTRTPAFDGDCQKHYPGRPHSYRYAGGTHAGRNHVGGQAGCKNRDVGVGWNSACCP